MGRRFALYAKRNWQNHQSDSFTINWRPTTDFYHFFDSETDLQFLNKSLSIIGELPVKHKKKKKKKKKKKVIGKKKKVHKIKGALLEKIKVISQNISPEDSTSTEG